MINTNQYSNRILVVWSYSCCQLQWSIFLYCNFRYFSCKIHVNMKLYVLEWISFCWLFPLFHVQFVCSHNFFQSLKHNPNGRFVVVCGDGEYIIYTALAWRNRSFGSALEIVWSSDGEYAARESTSKIKIFTKNFQVCVHFSKYSSWMLE